MKNLVSRLFALVLLVTVALIGWQQGAVAALFTAAAMGSALAHLGTPAHVLGVNALGTLSSALIVQRALSLVFTKRPILKRFSLDLSGEGVLFNQQVITRVKTVPAVTNFSQVATDVVTTDIPVTIDQFKQALVSFTPQQLAATDRNLIDEQAEPMAVAVANYLVDDVANLFSDVNFPDTLNPSGKTVTTVANTGYSTLVALRKALIKRGAPEGFKKFCLVNADVYEKLLNDPLCNRQAKVVETGNDPITTGELLGVAGFEAISEYPALPGTNNMVAAAGTPDAIVLAARVPKDPRSVLPGVNVPFNLSVVTDPGSGLSVMVQEWIGTDLTANVRLCWMHGRAAGNTNNLQRQVTA